MPNAAKVWKRGSSDAYNELTSVEVVRVAELPTNGSRVVLE
jgi:hypothetical protein